MSFEFTNDYAVAQKWAAYDSKVSELFDLYCPAHLFTHAARSVDSFSFTIDDNKSFGMGFGAAPYWDPTWAQCSMNRHAHLQIPASFDVDGDWDVYAINTAPFSNEKTVEEATDNEEIDAFINEYAPHSSVHAGDPESLFWGSIRSPIGELLAVGTIVRWRSGHQMFASICSAPHVRGQGVGTQLIKSMLSTVHARGVLRIGLGVFAGNAPAKALYEKVGFELLQEFRAFNQSE